jgi:hypothetical protein
VRDLGEGVGQYPGSSDEYRRKEVEELEHVFAQELELPEELVQYGIYPENIQLEGRAIKNFTYFYSK